MRNFSALDAEVAFAMVLQKKLKYYYLNLRHKPIFKSYYFPVNSEYCFILPGQNTIY